MRLACIRYIMASKREPSKNVEALIMYWWVPLEVQSFDLDFITLKENFYASSSHTKDDLRTERLSRQRVVTPQFHSAAAERWDFVAQRTALVTSISLKNGNIHQESMPCHFNNEKVRPAACRDAGICFKDLECGSKFSSSTKSKFDDPRRIKMGLSFASCTAKSNILFPWCNPFSKEDSSRSDAVSIREAFTEKLDTPDCMSGKPDFVSKDTVDSTMYGCQANGEGCTISKENPPDFFSVQFTERIGKTEDQNSSVRKTPNLAKSYQNSAGSETELLEPSIFTKKVTITLKKPTSRHPSDCSINLLPSTNTLEQWKKYRDCNSELPKSSAAASFIKDCPFENDNLFRNLVILKDLSQKSWMALENRLQHAFSNNRHAIAGALAGSLVTLCLHPVDTVKTIMQANGTGNKSFYQVLKKTISQKGVLGLYRGISSNIASSAPISATYTFAYESIKGALLPLVPKDYHSFAHCIAGGCASLASSFIFTPSEIIKQQMQVYSEYESSWNAFIGCLQKGGISSLYVGWGAVLCRNIPHSIIKFYTYESLKKLFSSGNSGTKHNTVQTLVCGGLAGSTAALFTTPFDVVKTRLQAQAPGSLGKYHGVFHALQEIARQDGFQGLYRGLIPRLAIYVSQGAIFFASYEFLISLFLLGVPRAPTPVYEVEDSTDHLETTRTHTLSHK